MEGQINRLRRCEKITAPRPRRLGRLMCGKPSAFRQAPQPSLNALMLSPRYGKAEPFRRSGGRAAIFSHLLRGSSGRGTVELGWNCFAPDCYRCRSWI